MTYASGQVPVTMWAEASGSAEHDQSSCLINAATSVQRDATNATILVVTPERLLQNGYTYHIRPNVVPDDVATLNCDIPFPKPVAQWKYTFCVGTEIAADINADRRVNISDFNVLTSHFGNSGCLLDGDVNADGTVDIADFNIVAGHFGEDEDDIGATCNAAPAMRSAAGENEEIAQFTAAVEKLGFESLADFSAWLEELAPEDQLDALIELLSQLSE